MILSNKKIGIGLIVLILGALAFYWEVVYIALIMRPSLLTVLAVILLSILILSIYLFLIK